ncbi:MAG: hypothetical protein WCY82_11440 [Desulfotomaculaceae bacterium]
MKHTVTGGVTTRQYRPRFYLASLGLAGGYGRSFGCPAVSAFVWAYYA